MFECFVVIVFIVGNIFGVIDFEVLLDLLIWIVYNLEDEWVDYLRMENVV